MKLLENNSIEVKRIMTASNDHEVLGLQPRVALKDVIDAHRQLILKYHPDKSPNEDQAVLSQLTNRIHEAKTNLTKRAKNIHIKKTNSDKPLSAHLGFCKPYNDYIQTTGMSIAFSLMDEVTSRLDRVLGHIVPPSAEIVSAESTDIGLKLSLMKMLMEVRHDSETFGLAMTLAWVQSLIQDTESFFINLMKAGYYPESAMNLYELAAYVHPLVNSDQIKKHIEERTLSERLDAGLTDNTLYTSTPVRISWNYNLDTLKNMLLKQLEFSPDIPFVLYNRIKDKQYFIGIIKEGSAYKVFSPYEPAFSDNINALVLYSEEELVNALKAHFYSDDPNQKVPVAITSFKLAPIELKPKGHDLMVLGDQGSSMIMHQRNFMTYLLDEFTPNSEHSTRYLLESIRDGHNAEVLKQIFPRAPEQFTDAILCEFLDQAIAQNSFFMALEISTFNDDKAIRKHYVNYYINRYLNEVKNFDHLDKMIAAFEKVGFRLADYLDESNKNCNTFFKRHLQEIIDNKNVIANLIKLGIVPTQDQIASLLSKISLIMIENHRKSTIKFTLWEHQKQQAQEDNLKLIELIQILTNNRVNVYQPSGLPAQEYLGLSLIRSGHAMVVIQLLQDKQLQVDQIDDSGKTLLNHCSRDKNWFMVDFLHHFSAPFSTGKHISYKEIPPLHAWLENVPELETLYSKVDPEYWKNLMIRQVDVLAVFLQHGKNHSVTIEMLKGQFEGALKKNLIPYAFASLSDLSRLKMVIDFSGISRQNKIINTIKPLHFDEKNYLNTQVLNPQENNKTLEEIPNLLGLTEKEADKIVSAFFSKPFNKIKQPHTARIYYSHDHEFINEIEKRLHPSNLLSFLKALKNQIRHSSDYLDLGDMIKTITAIYHEAYILNKQSESRSYDMGDLYSRSNKELHHHSRGVKLQLDKQGRVTDYYLMPHPAYITDDYSGVDKGSPSNLYFKTSHFLAELHEITPILAQAAPLRFSNHPNHPASSPFLNTVNAKLNDWNKLNDPYYLKTFQNYLFPRRSAQTTFSRSHREIVSDYAQSAHAQLLFAFAFFEYFISPRLAANQIRALTYEETYDLIMLQEGLPSLEQQFHQSQSQIHDLEDYEWFSTKLRVLKRQVHSILNKEKASTNQLIDIRSGFDRVGEKLHQISDRSQFKNNR